MKFFFLDSPYPWQLGFQDPATPLIIGIVHFYNFLIIFLVAIGAFVLWIIIRALILFKNPQENHTYTKVSKFSHSTSLEIVWTLVPAIVLCFIAGPSFALLYSFDETLSPKISIKVIGHQWYWSYEYSDIVHKASGKTINFDSYIMAEEDLSLGQFRLLETDNRLVLPTKTHIRVLVSAADVLHSWAVPSLGIKIDACPGRLNQGTVYLLRSGTFYGQCSELCGVNHGFMPIVVESRDSKSYILWANDQTKCFTTTSGGSGGSDIPEFIPSREILELLQSALDDKNHADKLVRQDIVLSSLRYDIEIMMCPEIPEFSYTSRYISPEEKGIVLNSDCSKARAFLTFDLNSPKPQSKEDFCASMFETFYNGPLYNTEGLDYYHNNDLSCKKVVYLLGGDPTVVDVVNLEEKSYLSTKSFFDGCYDQLVENEKTYVSKRFEILGEYYNFDGYCDKFNKPKN